MKFTATALLCFVASCAASRSFIREHNRHLEKFTKDDGDVSLFRDDSNSQSWSDSGYSSEEAHSRDSAKGTSAGALSKRAIRKLTEIVPDQNLNNTTHPNKALSIAVSDYIEDKKTKQLLVKRVNRQPDFVATELLNRRPLNLLEYIAKLLEADSRVLRDDLRGSSKSETTDYTGTVHPKRTVSLRKKSKRQSRRSKSSQSAILKHQVLEENLEILSQRFAVLRNLHQLPKPNERLVKLVARHNRDLERTLRERVAKDPAYLVQRFLQVKETETKPILRVREMLNYTA